MVIESKLFANAKEEQALMINTKGVKPASTEYVPVKWDTLFDSWWNLSELGALGATEAEPMADFFDFVEQNFGDLLPFSDLNRCRDNRRRQQRRLRTVLASATGLPAEPRGDAMVKFPDSIVAVQRVNLWIEDKSVVLGMWPAELAPQYRRVYADPKKVENLITLCEQPGWELHPNFHLSYWLAAPDKRWYPVPTLSGPTYALQWIEDFKDKRAGRRDREAIADKSFTAWLVERSYATRSELASLTDWLQSMPREQADIRPSIAVRRTWRLNDAAARGGADAFSLDVQKAIGQVLEALGEPHLASPSLTAD